MMVPTLYQAMLVAQEQSKDLLRKAEQERLVQAAQGHERTRRRWPSLASLFGGAMNMASRKRFRLRLNG
ncbi:MAG TPA: hypothetical protein ENJ31_02790 [Anaerolineae bacterium]|nr:hypothetical protein [Anaerolineae bacterium]